MFAYILLHTCGIKLKGNICFFLGRWQKLCFYWIYLPPIEHTMPKHSWINKGFLYKNTPSWTQTYIHAMQSLVQNLLVYFCWFYPLNKSLNQKLRLFTPATSLQKNKRTYSRNCCHMAAFPVPYCSAWCWTMPHVLVIVSSPLEILFI